MKYNCVYLLYWGSKNKEVTFNDLDIIRKSLPDEYNAKVDHRRTRDTLIFIDSGKIDDAVKYLNTKYDIHCVPFYV